MHLKGQATIVLSERFDSVTGVDPSSGMVATAQESALNPRINFVQSSAEQLRFLEDESVDFIGAGALLLQILSSPERDF